MLSAKDLCLTYQLAFILNFLSCYFIMKVLSLCCSPKFRLVTTTHFFFSPYLSLRSFGYKGKNHALNIFLRLTSWGTLFALMLIFIPQQRHYSYGEVILLSPIIYVLTELLGALAELLFSWNTGATFSIHQNPIMSNTLSEFWGRRWNRWVQDWLRDIHSYFNGMNTRGRILITFLFSGLFHEVMINLPYYLYFGKSTFGTMILYFCIQSAGLFVDKKYLRRCSPYTRRIFLWIVVLGPSPLFLNASLLAFLGIE